ncbi:unnamed protein product [Rhodiola kirilowii]
MNWKEGLSTYPPPLLEGPNYLYWKSKMKVFLKSLDEKAWRAVLVGWTEPTMANPGGVAVPKPEALWTDADEKAAAGNSKALNAIFFGVDENMFKLIAECEVTKEACDILRIAYEGPDTEYNNEEEDHENVNLVGLVVTIEDCSETSENPYSSALSEQPVDDASSSDDEGLAHETSAETYKELYVKWLLVIGLNKKLTETVASLTEENDKKWQEVELLGSQKVGHQEEISSLKHEMIGINQERSSLLAQKVELLDTVSVPKAEMKKNREIHPAGLVELRRKNADLSRKEVHLLNKVESLELQIEMERDNHAATMKELSKFKRSAKMLNSGSNNLESILRSQRIEDGHRGLGFNGNSASYKTSSVKAKLKPAQRAE